MRHPEPVEGCALIAPSGVLIGGSAAAIIAIVARRARALTRGGAIAAFVVGTLTFAALGIVGATVLLAFFVPSVLLSRLGRARKRALVDVGKHGARDAWQVLANGGVATACAVASAIAPQDVRWSLAFAGAYAAATADTWATEIGTLAARMPRSILTLRPIAPGMSGGVSAAGTAAEVAGALWIGAALIGVVALARGDVGFSWNDRIPLQWHVALLLLAVPIGGVAGATLDSLLGATLQELRWCEACERACETDPHACGEPTRLIRGLRGISNDVVNVLATLAGAAVAFVLPLF